MARATVHPQQEWQECIEAFKPFEDPIIFDRIKRLWAIEQGRVEYIYTLTDETVLHLAIHGIERTTLVRDPQMQNQDMEEIIAQMNDEMEVCFSSFFIISVSLF